MRSEGNSLDLNNLPEEFGKQAIEESSTTTAASTDATRFKKKKSIEKDDSSKIYECRFCSLKFSKSQALGGHMNRHRQERETETLNRARQLVFNNEGLVATGPHMGYRDINVGTSQAVPLGGFQHRISNFDVGADSRTLQFRPLYPRLPSQALIQSYVYTSSSSHNNPYPTTTTYATPTTHPSLLDDYFIGHVMSDHQTSHKHQHHTNFTCYGAPSNAFQIEGLRGPSGRDATSSNQTDNARNWSSTSYRQG